VLAVGEMSSINLIITLMVLVAVIIIGIAIYVFTHLSGLNAAQGFILLGVAIGGLILVMGVIFMLVKNLNVKK
jgi:hypothetical protein